MLNLYLALRFMRNIHRHILLSFIPFLCLWFSAAAAPQSDNYDKALDKYAVICDRCVELRSRSESGQGVGMEELKALLVELSSLRRTLSNASGKMSVAQSERFEAIKAKYNRGMRAFEKPDRPMFVPVPKIVPVTEHVEVTSHTPCSKSLRWLVSPVEPQARRPKDIKLTILAEAGIFPTPSYGAMVVATWKDVGAYLNYQSDFHKEEYSYTCTSEGDTEYGRIWATGNSVGSRTVATAGLAMFTSSRFGFHCGAGLTYYIRC